MHASMVRKPYPLAIACTQQAKAAIAVAVAGVVPEVVAVRRPAIPGIVAPVAAAIHAVRA